MGSTAQSGGCLFAWCTRISIRVRKRGESPQRRPLDEIWRTGLDQTRACIIRKRERVHRVPRSPTRGMEIEVHMCDTHVRLGGTPNRSKKIPNTYNIEHYR